MTGHTAIRRIVQTILWATLASHAAAQISEWEIQGLRDGTHPYTLPPLSFDSLEPHIDAKTMEFHYRQYHAACVTNLNKSIAKEFQFYVRWESNAGTKPPGSDVYGEWLEEMLTVPSSMPEAIRGTIRTNAGGHYNHSLFWQMMKKDGGGEPTGELAGAIKKEFGSFTAFKKKFTQAALAQAGEGWAWLTLDAGALKVEALPNEENPLSLGRPVLLGIDLWDHAYQLKYPNQRAEYVAAWFNVVHWDFVAERYARLKSRSGAENSQGRVQKP